MKCNCTLLNLLYREKSLCWSVFPKVDSSIRISVCKVCVLLAMMFVCNFPASILRKSTSGRHRPVSYPDGPMTARYRFTWNADWAMLMLSLFLSYFNLIFSSTLQIQLHMFFSVIKIFLIVSFKHYYCLKGMNALSRETTIFILPPSNKGSTLKGHNLPQSPLESTIFILPPSNKGSTLKGHNLPQSPLVGHSFVLRWTPFKKGFGG